MSLHLVLGLLNGRSAIEIGGLTATAQARHRHLSRRAAGQVPFSPTGCSGNSRSTGRNGVRGARRWANPSSPHRFNGGAVHRGIGVLKLWKRSPAGWKASAPRELRPAGAGRIRVNYLQEPGRKFDSVYHKNNRLNCGNYKAKPLGIRKHI